MTFPMTKRAVVIEGVAHNPHRMNERLALVAADGSSVFAGNNHKFTPITTATAIGTAAKTTTAAEPAANTIVPIKFTSGNSAAAPTVAFAGGSARAIHLGGSTPAAIEITVAANGVAMFWFDGTILHQIGVYS